MAVQWFRRHTSNAGDAGLVPGLGTKIPRAMWNGEGLPPKTEK